MNCFAQVRWFACLLFTVAMPFEIAQAATAAAQAWQFSFSGDDTGTGTATVDAQGVLQGSGHSERFGMDVTLAGQVDADGALSLTATPTGATSSGAVFTGKVSGDRGSGSWRNDPAGLSGAWTARQAGQRSPGSSQQVHCRIDGEEFDATPPIVADAMIR